MQDRKTYKNIEPESTTHAVGLTPGYILEQCLTELQIYFQCGYSRAIYPCYIGDSSSRLLQPYGTATSALALPIVFAPNEESGDGSVTGTVDGRRSNWPEDFDPLLQGHFLQTQSGHDKIPFPVVFIALVEEIYELLAGAVLHRRALGVDTPCLAFAHDPLNCQLRAVWAWCVSPEDGSCPEVHVAHAPWSTPLSHLLGVFDVQDQDSAYALAKYLHAIKRELCRDASTAEENAPITRVSLLSSPATHWRIDQNAFLHGDPNQTGLVEDIDHWLGGVQAWSETSGTSPQEEEDVFMKSPVEPDPNPADEDKDEDEDEDEGEDEDKDEDEDEDEDKVAEAKSTLAEAKYDIEHWMKAHPEIVFAEPSHWTTEETAQCGAPSLSPEIALVYGLRATRCAFPVEFLEEEKTPEPLKIALEYIRSAFPPSPDLSSIAFSEVNVPTLPDEIMMDEEPSVGPPCTLERLEDIEAFLNFCAAAQVENWIRLALKMEGMAPLDPAMVTYLMENIPTFLKVSEMCTQANAILSGNAALYGECFDLLLGAHGSVCKVYKRFELQIYTARQRLFDEHHTLADQIRPGGCLWGPNSYPHASKFERLLFSAAKRIPRNDLKTSLEISAVACFDGMKNAIKRDRYEAMEAACQQRAIAFEFLTYWHIMVDGMKGFSTAALQVVHFDSLACDAVLCTPLPVDISVDDLKTISLFQDGVPRDTTSVSSPSSTEMELPEMPRESLDLIIDKVLPPSIVRSEVPRQLGILDGNSRMHEQRQHLDKLLALSLPLVLLEYTNGGLDPEKGATQTRLHLTMACRFMVSLGIHDFPIFGLSTSRSRVRLFCAWAESPTTRMSMIFIADANCPEWDISKPRDAIRLGLFLQHLRTTHRDRLEQKFDEVKRKLSESWKHKDSWTPQERALREWKIGHQKDNAEYNEWLKKAAEAWPEFYSLQAQVDQAQSAVDRAKEEFGDYDSDVDFI